MDSKVGDVLYLPIFWQFQTPSLVSRYIHFWLEYMDSIFNTFQAFNWF